VKPISRCSAWSSLIIFSEKYSPWFSPEPELTEIAQRLPDVWIVLGYGNECLQTLRILAQTFLGVENFSEKFSNCFLSALINYARKNFCQVVSWL
jgi:hypothetical protein